MLVEFLGLVKKVLKFELQSAGKNIIGHVFFITRKIGFFIADPIVPKHDFCIFVEVSDKAESTC